MTTLSILLQSAAGSGMSSILMMVALIAIFYFFMIRPQTKRQKEIRKFREGLSAGDKIVTRVRIAKDSVYPSVADAKDSGAQQAK